jgi:hypothetical protein
LGGATNEELIEKFRRERRGLARLDLDFANPLRFQPSQYPGIAMLRLAPKPSAAELTNLIRTLARALTGDSIAGKLWIVEPGRAIYWKFGKYHNRKEGELAYVFILPKSKKSVRDIDMSPEMRKQLLELYMRTSTKGLVFCSPTGTPLNPDNFVKRNFSAVLRRAEAERAKNKQAAIGKVRWHDLRHTFGSLKLDQGEDLVYVSRQMGHSSPSVTADIYAHQIRARSEILPKIRTSA